MLLEDSNRRIHRKYIDLGDWGCWFQYLLPELLVLSSDKELASIYIQLYDCSSFPTPKSNLIHHYIHGYVSFFLTSFPEFPKAIYCLVFLFSSGTQINISSYSVSNTTLFMLALSKNFPSPFWLCWAVDI